MTVSIVWSPYLTLNGSCAANARNAQSVAASGSCRTGTLPQLTAFRPEIHRPFHSIASPNVFTNSDCASPETKRTNRQTLTERTATHNHRMLFVMDKVQSSGRREPSAKDIRHRMVRDLLTCRKIPISLKIPDWGHPRAAE